MKKLLFYWIISICAFSLGVFGVSRFYPQVSLEEITQNNKYFDGKKVEIVSYAQIFRVDEESITIGQPFEKNEVLIFIDFPENPNSHTNLWKQLIENFSVNKYKRVKTRIVGTVIDNCRHGVTCCFGKSLKIIPESIEQIGQIEDYSVPTEFQINAEKPGSE